VLNSLAGMARGEAFVWSPEIDFGPTRIKFPLFKTFDSFAPPQLQRKIADKDWSTVDLEEVKIKLAGVIEEARANDPVLLRKELALAKRELADSQRTKKVVPAAQARIEIPVFIKSERSRLTRLIGELEKLNARLESAETERARQLNNFAGLKIEIDEFRQKLSAPPFGAQATNSTVQPRPAHAIAAPPAARRPVPTPSNDSNGALPPGEEKILTACIQFVGKLKRQQLTVLTGFKRSTRDAYIARLKEKGLVETNGELVVPTDLGFKTLPVIDALPTGKPLQKFWLDRLPEGEKKIFDLLISSYPEPLTRDSISEATGFKRSTRDAYLSRMSSKLLFTEPSRGQVRASDQLFE
jgi:hypothetical protein